MFCKNCGAQLPENAAFCSRCGASASEATVSESPSPAQPVFMPQQAPQPPKKNACVTAGLVLSILSVPTFFAGPFNLLLYAAIVCTIIGLVQTKKRGGKKGKSIASLCLIGVAILAFILFLFIPDTDGSSTTSSQEGTTQPPVETTVPLPEPDEDSFSIYDSEIKWNMTMDEVAAIVANGSNTYERGNDYIRCTSLTMDWMAGSSLSGDLDYMYFGVSKAYIFDESGKLEHIEYIFQQKQTIEGMDYTILGVWLLGDYGLDSEQYLNTQQKSDGEFETQVSTDAETLFITTYKNTVVIGIWRK